MTTQHAGQAGSGEHTPTHLPWRLHGTSIYFADVAGGFDVRNCPDPENLAAFIHRACNSHASLSAENATLREQSKKLREALLMARQKLVLYRANSSGAYHGGMEYTALLSMINAALSPDRKGP